MPYKGIEADVEQAIVAAIEAQLTADSITGVRVDSITGGCADDEITKPYVWVTCAPVEHRGAGRDQWTGSGEVHIVTQHLTGKDRDATNLVNLLASVGYALDYGTMTPTVVNSIQIRRLSGEWNFEDSSNSVILPYEIVMACG